jgi:23S rRNA (uracil1939-C5)-methyltransferase
MEALIQKFSQKGLGVVDDVEVAHVIPGDKILIDLMGKRKRKKGRLLEVLSPSKDRVDPKCKHANTCGGCCWQQMSYQAQLLEKENRVREAFGVEPDPIIPSDEIFGYRNKMEFTFSQNKAGEKFLGLMIAQSNGHVFNLSECHLTSQWFADAVASVRTWWEISGLEAYFPPADRGSLRYLTLREAKRTSQKMAILNVSGNPDYALNRSQLNGYIAAIQSAAGEDASIFLRIHQTQKGRPTSFYEMHLAGPDHIIEELNFAGVYLTFKISPVSFFQPNSLAAEKLYSAAIAMIPKCATVFDLYCGTGTLGMAVSRFVHKVIGIELSPEAVIDAQENIRRNQIANMTVYQGDVGKVISDLLKDPHFVRPDAVIVDPPRAGLDPLAISHLKNLLPKTIVYVSCNPLTQAQNVAELQAVGYVLRKLQPVDQFPHTYHIENIALLDR